MQVERFYFHSSSLSQLISLFDFAVIGYFCISTSFHSSELKIKNGHFQGLLAISYLEYENNKHSLTPD